MSKPKEREKLKQEIIEGLMPEVVALVENRLDALEAKQTQSFLKEARSKLTPFDFGPPK